MDYECTTVSLDRLLVNVGGFVQPICTNCRAPDCTNPIREQTVSIAGIPRKMRLWVVSNVVRQVVSCKGFVGDDDEFTDEV